MRFYLKSVTPELELYMSSINFDPLRPPFPISYPESYSKRLARKIGFYHTQGMPHDTWALSENIVDEKAFLEHVDEILKEKKKILEEELRSFKGGAFFFYFDTLDAVQHMFWRYLDPQSPSYEKNTLYQDTIFRYYEKIDQIIGDVLKMMDKDTDFIILSDHGFNTFRRAVHLNRWLLENGYLFLKEGAKESKEFFKDVDWSKTKAYALGFGGIYLNKIGREYYGIVDESQASALKQAIKRGMEQLRDPANNAKIINNVYLQEEIYQGIYKNDAPDLYVGFNAGYRASWESALGGTPALLIEDNIKKWSGDHIIDPVLVPGVIFTNKKIAFADAAIVDIFPTLLHLFNIDKPDETAGKALF